MGPSAGDVVASSVRLERRLAEGGMGNVWLARHLALHTQVVVKFMHESLVKDAVARERFSKEAVAASQVKSPHVVQTFDHGVTEAGLPFIVMELLEGEDLAQCLGRRGRLTLVEVASIVVQVGRALSRAHERGVVHRDIKPENIFLCDQGGDEPFVKLLDFGIARTGTSPTSTTLGGATMGTPFYMSPEQFLGARNIDYRTDLWSLGVVAFEAAVGVRPFDADTLSALAIAVHSGPIPNPSEYDPALHSIDAWFSRACARDPRERFASAKDMADALTMVVTGEPQGPLATLLATQMERPRPARRPSRHRGAEASVDDHEPSRITADAAMVRAGSIEPAPPRPLWVLSAIATVSIIAGLSMAIGVKSWLDEKGSAAESASFVVHPPAPQTAKAHGSMTTAPSYVPILEQAKVEAKVHPPKVDVAEVATDRGSIVASAEPNTQPPAAAPTVPRKSVVPNVSSRLPASRPAPSAPVAGAMPAGGHRVTTATPKKPRTVSKHESKEEDIE